MMNKISEFFKGLLKSKSLRYGTNAVILTAVVVAIAVFVNILVGMTGLKLDLTANKLYSIGDETKKILNDLKKDVTIYGLFDEGKVDSDYKEVTELLGHYAKNPHIKIQYVDPDKNPTIIKDLDPDNLKDLKENDFVVKSGSKSKKLEYYDLFSTEFDQQTFQQYKTGSTAEQGFSGAIKYVTSETTPVIYFSEGHNEGKLDSEYRTVKDYLEKNNYDVKTLNLLAQEKVPGDAELLMVASPKSDLAASETEKINEYIKNGGKAIFLFDSLENDPSFANVDNLLKDYNLALNYDKVKENDESRHFPDNPYAVILDVKSSSIISENFNLVLANSRSINTLKNQKEYITVTSLMKTSDKAVGEQIDKSRGADNQGPLDVAVAVDYKGGAKPGKIIVMGNGLFISDAAKEQYGPYFTNGMVFFLSSLNWMLDKKDEVIIAPKTYDAPRLQISALQANLMGVVVVVVLPVIILITGLVVYLRRRHL